MPSPAVTLVIILLAIAGAGIGLSVVLAGANMITAFVGMGSLLVAAVGIVTAPWLASRSGRGAVGCTVVAIAAVIVAALLLVTSPPSNSSLWVPINIGRFGGIIVAQLGLALALHAALTRRLGPMQALALVVANALAVATGIAIAGWESRA